MAFAASEVEGGVESQWASAAGQPDGHLGSVVRSYVGWQESAGGPVRRWEAPTGGIALILSFGPSLRVSSTSLGTTTEVSSFVVGMYDEPALTEHDGIGHGVQVNLTAAGAYALLGVPVHELSNQVIPVDAIDGLDAERIVQRLLESPTLATRFAVLDNELGVAVSESRRRLSPEVAWVEHQLRRHPNARIDELRYELGWSRSRLAERFRREIGVPPKTLARILRFRRAVDRLLAPGTIPSLSLVAAECGYADQSHFNREFRSLSGRTPTEFLAAERGT